MLHISPSSSSYHSCALCKCNAANHRQRRRHVPRRILQTKTSLFLSLSFASRWIVLFKIHSLFYHKPCRIFYIIIIAVVLSEMGERCKVIDANHTNNNNSKRKYKLSSTRIKNENITNQFVWMWWPHIHMSSHQNLVKWIDLEKWFRARQSERMARDMWPTQSTWRAGRERCEWHSITIMTINGLLMMIMMIHWSHLHRDCLRAIQWQNPTEWRTVE